MDSMQTVIAALLAVMVALSLMGTPRWARALVVFSALVLLADALPEVIGSSHPTGYLIVSGLVLGGSAGWTALRLNRQKWVRGESERLNIGPGEKGTS